MSDSPAPSKPKVGSLRDRIAAFEKTAATPAPGPAPAPRPKPAGFASWKPKQPSPPSSPPANKPDHAGSPGSAAMSASDAKESITKGASLKERMAALQGKGAFAAPPPVAPKPAVERPKWKPPPVVRAPSDDEDDAQSQREGQSTDAVTAAIERSILPSAAKPQDESPEGEATDAKPSIEGEPQGEDAPVDPEEEERQRRAAIAARMARLGGARLGMAPPILGKKPPMRRSTQEATPPAIEASESTPAAAEPSKDTDRAKSPEGEGVIEQAPPVVSPPIEQPSGNDQTLSENPSPPNKAETPATSVDSADAHAPKGLSSMPLPAAPRRTGPPRKKPTKPVAPPPEVQEVVVEEGPTESASADVEGKIGKLELGTESEKVDENHPEHIVDSIKPDPQTVVEESSKEDSTGSPLVEKDEPVSQEGVFYHASPNPPVDERSNSTPLEPEISAPPKENETIPSPVVEVSNSPSVPQLVPPATVNLPEETIAAIVEAVDESPLEVNDSDDEEARKKRIAEKLAKMGGFNPFAPHPRVVSPPQQAAADSVSPPVTSPTLPPAVPPPALSTEKKENLEDSQTEPKESDDKDDVSEYDSEPSEQHENSTTVSDKFVSSEQRLGPGASQPTVQSDASSEPQQEEVMPRVRAAQHPRTILPPTPDDSLRDDQEDDDDEADDEADERLAQSHLFIRPPTERSQDASHRRGLQTEDEDEEFEANDSGNDAPPLPVPNRRTEVLTHPSARRIREQEEDEASVESDHDGTPLPIPPRRVSHPPPARAIPPPSVPPPSTQQSPPPIHAPQPMLAQVTRDASLSPAPSQLTPSLSVSGSEILDEEEGDPIDPAFHSPSRRASYIGLSSSPQPDIQQIAPSQSPPIPASSPPTLSSLSHLPASTRSPPPARPLPAESVPPSRLPAAQTVVPSASDDSADAEQVNRRTIAERMAKLGGIKFGALPPAPGRPLPPARRNSEQQEAREEQPTEVTEESATETTEEEEEKARKERIAAKLAHMGGMRIGMMPMDSRPPQRSRVLKDEPSSPPSGYISPKSSQPHHPPPPQPSADTEDSEHESIDGVKVEAEESEIEELNYVEPEEEAPPPIPSRSGRGHPHRQDTSDSTASHPPPPSRPPVPVPVRRTSVQTTKSTSSSAGVESASVRHPQRQSSIPPSQTEYVMVEEPEVAVEVPPPPPARPASRLPPSRTTPHAPSPTTMSPSDPADSISSQWELPNIPTPNFDFGAGADLSLSWTDAGEPASSVKSSPQLPSHPKAPAVGKPMSADDLMAVWGRVGVQVCEMATTLFDKSKKALIGDGTFAGFVNAVLAGVPNALPSSIVIHTSSRSSDSYHGNEAAYSEYGYLIYAQHGSSVTKRASEILPGDIIEVFDAKFKGHKGLQTYHQNVGADGDVLVGIVGEYEAKKNKVKVFQANQHVGQQTVESVSYRLEDLKTGSVKVYRVLEAA